MSKSFRERRAKAVLDHARKAYIRIEELIRNSAADAQDEEDAYLAMQLAAIELEEAQAIEDFKIRLLKRADDILGSFSNDLVIQWRKDFTSIMNGGV